MPDTVDRGRRFGSAGAKTETLRGTETRAFAELRRTNLGVKMHRPRLDAPVMPLLGTAAMLLSFDVAEDAIAEHDDWHTHEHLPERLSIPGFLRGTRWTALRGQPRYMVLYEVAALATLTSDAYLERLNHPSAWTQRVMPHYRGMRRGLCTVSGSFGHGMGHIATLFRFKPAPGAAPALREWLLQQALPPLPPQRGVGSVHLLEGAVTAPMTDEQRIRGTDQGVDWALLVTGYGDEALADVQRELRPEQLGKQGATEVVAATYRIDYSLTRPEMEA